MAHRGVKIIWTIVLAMLSTHMVAQHPNSPFIFDSYEWNFGTIDEQDGIVHHTFTFINKSNSEAKIHSILTSCGCTTTTYSTEPIAPGKSGTITVSFNPAGTEGEVMREIEVYGAEGRSCDRLLLLSNVNPAPLTMDRLYPRQIVNGIRSATLTCNFGYVEHGESVTRGITLANTTKTPQRVEIRNNNREVFTIDAPMAINAESVENINITCALSDKRLYGMLRDTVWVKANEVVGENPIVITAIATDRFDESETSPHPTIRIEPSLLNMQRKRGGRIAKGTITIENSGNADLIIRHIETSQGIATDIYAGMILLPSESRKIGVVATNITEATSTNIGSIYITSNDPIRPFREIRVQSKKE